MQARVAKKPMEMLPGARPISVAWRETKGMPYDSLLNLCYEPFTSSPLWRGLSRIFPVNTQQRSKVQEDFCPLQPEEFDAPSARMFAWLLWFVGDGRPVGAGVDGFSRKEASGEEKTCDPSV
ncbi:hypothetical protein KM043_001028 [Ampulex compressa]|nr:hypothetical protein KM043_001028 [Ampulex compressa]